MNAIYFMIFWGVYILSNILIKFYFERDDSEWGKRIIMQSLLQAVLLVSYNRIFLIEDINLISKIFLQIIHCVTAIFSMLMVWSEIKNN